MNTDKHKTSTKIISLLIAQVFLVTSLAYPSDIKDISSLYTPAKSSLRKPMDSIDDYLRIRRKLSIQEFNSIDSYMNILERDGFTVVRLSQELRPVEQGMPDAPDLRKVFANYSLFKDELEQKEGIELENLLADTVAVYATQNGRNESKRPGYRIGEWNHVLMYAITRLVDNFNHAGVADKVVAMKLDLNERRFYLVFRDFGKGIPEENLLKVAYIPKAGEESPFTTSGYSERGWGLTLINALLQKNRIGSLMIESGSHGVEYSKDGNQRRYVSDIAVGTKITISVELPTSQSKTGIYHASWLNVKKLSRQNYHKTALRLPGSDSKNLNNKQIRLLREDKIALDANDGQVIEIQGYKFYVCIDPKTGQKVLISTDIKDTLRDREFIEILSSALSNARFTKTNDGLPLIISSLFKSPKLFEDCIQNGFIGINQAFLGLYQKSVDIRRQYLKILLQIGLEHELRHEMGEVDEETVVDRDIHRIIKLCQEHKIEISKLVRFLVRSKIIIGKEFISKLDSALIDLTYDMLREKGALINRDLIKKYPISNQKAQWLLNAMYERYGSVEREIVGESFLYKDGFAIKVKKHVEALRAEFRQNPLAFLEKAADDSPIIEYMEGHPPCSIWYGDIKLTSPINKTFIEKIGHKLIPLMINAADVVLKEHGGIAARIGGDEAGLATDLSQEEANNIRLELQAALAEFINGMYGFVKVNGVNDVEDINGWLGTDGITGIYKDKDGFFLVFNRIEMSRNLIRDCDKAIGSINHKGFDISKVGKPVKIPSPRMSFGIVQASSDYNNSISHAEYVKHIAAEKLGLNGATSKILGELDKFEEEMKTPSIRKLSPEERYAIAEEYIKAGVELNKMVDKYRQQGINIELTDLIEEYYPVIKRGYLYDVMQEMKSAGIGTTILVRGPPENIYMVTKAANRDIYLAKIEFLYEPWGEFKTRVEDAVRKGKFTKDNLRQRWYRREWLGFKAIKELAGTSSDHAKGSRVILAEISELNKILGTSGLREKINNPTQENLQDLANEIASRVEKAIQHEADTGVKVILGAFKVGGEEKEAIDIVDDLTKTAEYAPGNIVNIYDKDKEEPFNRRSALFREKERNKFGRILFEGYSEDALTKRGLATYTRLDKPDGVKRHLPNQRPRKEL